jgi:hypothetical protein
MTRSTKMTVAVSALAVATMAAAQTTIPLAQKRFDYVSPALTRVLSCIGGGAGD